MDLQEPIKPLSHIQFLIPNEILASAEKTHLSETRKEYIENQKDCEPILSSLLTPYDAFKDGFERAIASFITLGQEEPSLGKVILSPQPKCEETKLLEHIIKNLLEDFDSVKFIKKNNRYFAISKTQLYQFSILLERANFNHIILTPFELQAYQQLLDSGRLFQLPYLHSINRRPTENDFASLDPEAICSSLTFPEKEAINIYTGNLYAAMNHFLRGDVDEAIRLQTIPDSLSMAERTNHCIKEVLLHIAVATSGLNKLPDYVPPEGKESEIHQYVFRGERHLPESVLKKRKIAVLQGGGITNEMGFISASFSKPTETYFNENTKVGILIKNIKGKKITPLSLHGEKEREILIPPTQMQWLYTKDIITTLYQNHMTLFIAVPITVDPSLTIDFTALPADEWLSKTVHPNEEQWREEA